MSGALPLAPEVRGGGEDSPLMAESGPPTTAEDGALAYLFLGRRLLVRETDQGGDGRPGFRLPEASELTDLVGPGALLEAEWLPLGHWPSGGLQRPVLTRRLESSVELPTGWHAGELRGLYGGLDEQLFWLAGRAIQIVDWHEQHRFCGRCGVATELHPTERAKVCEPCGLSHFPRLAPAVIVLVERGDEVLLGRSPHFPPGMFSTLAGFVEPGEALEHTVRREIEEEVGVIVGDIRYFGSQPWPFPHSLMIGFKARWQSGDIRIDGEEIAEAGWFRHDRLPRIPPRLSIARSLIESFRAEWSR